MFYICTTSKYLMLGELETFCQRFIKKNINHETVETIRDVAQQNLLTEIVDYTTNFLEMNFEDFTGHNEMLEWPPELVQELVKSDKLGVRSEEKVVELVSNWLNHQFDSRKVHMDQFLNEIRFSFLNQDKINDAIADDVCLSILKRFTNRMTMHQKSPQRVYRPRLYYECIYLFARDIADCFKFFCYLPNSKSLVKLNSDCEHRTYMGSTILNNKVYYIGGYSSDHKNTNKVEVYDPVKDVWSVGQPLNVARTEFGCCTFEGRIYVIGGIKDRMEGGLRSEVYSPDEDRWQFVPGEGPQEHQTEVKAVAIGDSIFVVHSKNLEKRKFAHVIQQFKPYTNEWIDIPHDECLVAVSDACKIGIGRHGSKLIIIESSSRYLVYDTQMKTFQKFLFHPKLIKDVFKGGRLDTAVATFRDLMYVFGWVSRQTEVGYDLYVADFDPTEKLIPSRYTAQNTTTVQVDLPLIVEDIAAD